MTRLCECGCGLPPSGKKDRNGKPPRFIAGHQQNGKTPCNKVKTGIHSKETQASNWGY
jgi:hypothetical protein